MISAPAVLLASLTAWDREPMPPLQLLEVTLKVAEREAGDHRNTNEATEPNINGLNASLGKGKQVLVSNIL